MNSVKLCVTSLRRLEKKYKPAELGQIDAAVQRWIAADAARGINTVYVAIDDAAAMAAQGVTPVSGTVTALRAKRAIDLLWKKLKPDYLVILGAQDVIPYFEVANPSHNADDTDAIVPTDNPYACDKRFKATDRASYLVPNRVCGRIPDMVQDGDSAWLVQYLTRATAFAPQSASYFNNPYTICAATWKGAGKKSATHIGASPNALLISPPVTDVDAGAQTRLASRLHMIKCHGAELDPRFFGQSGNSYPTALESKTLKTPLTANTLAGAMCCYGAQIYPPNAPAATQRGDWPIASTYLRNGAIGFAGSTMIAWVGSSQMMCADWIVAGFLKAALEGASLGRAFLDSKLGYFQWLDSQGQTPDVADEKTMLEFVLYGDPSLHPVMSSTPAVGAGGVTVAAMFTSPLAASERQQRRIVRTRAAASIREELPLRLNVADRRPDQLARLAEVAAQVAAADAQGDGDGEEEAQPAAARASAATYRAPSAPSLVQRVGRGERNAAGRVVASRRAVAAPTGTDSYQYYWSDRTDIDGIKRIRLIKVETDAEGVVLRSRVLHSS